MSEDQKKEQMLNLVNILTERTRAGKISWIRKEDGYATPFKGGDIIEISCNFAYDEESGEETTVPINFLLIFTNSEGVNYDGFYVTNPEHDGFSNFSSLYNSILEKEKEDFLKKYNDYINEGK